MPLESGAKPGSAGFSRNVATEVNAGKPQKQAVAIAYGKARGDGELGTVGRMSQERAKLPPVTGKQTPLERLRAAAAEKRGDADDGTWDVQFQDPEGYSSVPKYRVKASTRDEAVRVARDRLNSSWATSPTLKARAKTFTLKSIHRNDAAGWDVGKSDAAQVVASFGKRADGLAARADAMEREDDLRDDAQPRYVVKKASGSRPWGVWINGTNVWSSLHATEAEAKREVKVREKAHAEAEKNPDRWKGTRMPERD